MVKLLSVESISILLLPLAAVFIIILAGALFVMYKRRKKELYESLETNKRFESLIETLQGGIILCRVLPDTGALKIIYMSEGWTRLTGYTYDDMAVQFKSNPQLLILPEDSGRCFSDYSKQTQSSNSYHLQYRFKHKDGSIRWAVDCGIVVIDKNGNIENQSILTDITDIKYHEEQLKVSEERFRISNMVSDTAIYEFDIQRNQYTYFENTNKVLGIEEYKLLQLFNAVSVEKDHIEYKNLVGKIIHMDDANVVREASKTLIEKGVSSAEVRFTVDNGYIWCKVNKTLIKDEFGNNLRVIGALTNIDESKRLAEELSLQVQSEPLTGLYNKLACKNLIERSLEANIKAYNAMLLIDIDNFKSINDTMGHTFGDMVIVDVATRLKGMFNGDEIVARIGGDEFLVFIANVENEVVAEDAANKICSGFRFTYSDNPKDYKISCSVGVVCSNRSNYFELIDHADLAMYEAKHLGKDRFAIYDQTKDYTNIRVIEANEIETSNSLDKNISEMIFDLLYSTSDFVGSINMVLAFLCNSFGFSYSYIFENTRDKHIAVNTFEWTNNSDRLSMPTLAPLDCDQMEQYDAFFKENAYYYSADTAQYDEYSQNALGVRKINAILHLPLMQGKELRGIVGFGKISPYDKPSEAEISSLISIMQILCIFISKQRAEDEIYHASKNKAHAMDSLPFHVYVTDNEHRILFLNQLVMERYKDSRIGEKCYKIFMDRDTVCEDCPKKKCEDGIARQKLVDGSGSNLLSAAKKLDWDGKDAYLITFQFLDDII